MYFHFNDTSTLGYSLQEFYSLPTEFTYYNNFVGKNRGSPKNYLQNLGKYVFNNLPIEYLQFTSNIYLQNYLVSKYGTNFWRKIFAITYLQFSY